MTQDQRQSLEILSAAFKAATDCGALDALSDFQRAPDCISDVIESLDEALVISRGIRPGAPQAPAANRGRGRREKRDSRVQD